MSDVATAAAAMGLPEALVERSVEARAAASGVSVDDLLTEWSGGEAAPAPARTEPEPAPAEEAEDTSTEGPEPETAPEVVVEVPSAPARVPEPVPVGPYKPPVLVGTRDNPMTVFAGAIGLFLIVVMVGLVGPSLPIEEAGARSSDLPFTEAALEGQLVYESVGCAACHTQMVRPIVADIGLGPVALSDTNQVLGSTRFGPDLSDVGSRITSPQIEAIIGGLGTHPAQSLEDADLSNLVAYLSESAITPESAEDES